MKEIISKTVLLLIILIVFIDSASARDQTGSYIWGQTDHGSFDNVQELVDAILVDPTAQYGSASYTFSASSDSAAKAMGHVYTAPVGSLHPTNGNSFILLSSGQAGNIAGSPSPTNEQHGTDFGGNQDKLRIIIPFLVSYSQLSFDFKFMTQETPSNINIYNDYFRAFICQSGTCRNVAIDANGNDVDVNHVNFNYPGTGTIFDYVTELNSYPYDIEPNVPFTLEFEIADVGDNNGDSAVFIDNLRFSKPLDSSVPEFPTVALPVIAVIGLMFLFQRRKGK